MEVAVEYDDPLDPFGMGYVDEGPVGLPLAPSAPTPNSALEHYSEERSGANSDIEQPEGAGNTGGLGDEAAQNIADAAIESATLAPTSAWPMYVSPSNRAADHAELVMRRVNELPSEIKGFYVSVSEKKKIRRLHCAGACWRLPGRDYKDFVALGEDPPDPAEFDVKCRDCWRHVPKAEMKKEAAGAANKDDGATSDDSSSESSSSASGSSA